MKRMWFIAVFAAIGLIPVMMWAQAAECGPVGQIRFVCGQNGPEDLVEVPGSTWLIASAYGAEGGIHLIDTKAGSSARLFPSPMAKERLDKTYSACPGPLEGADKDRFRTHGLYLKSGRNSLHTLYVVHHGARESIELFELDAKAKPPVVTWIGCVVAPDPIGLNAVVALPDGGFAATNFDTGPRPARVAVASLLRCWLARTTVRSGSGTLRPAGRRFRAARPLAQTVSRSRKTASGTTWRNGAIDRSCGSRADRRQ